jgi:hypothetical protein
MERKMYKIFGIVITLLLVFSLAATFATPTTVAAGSQEWSDINLPSDVAGQLLPGTDISTIAVTPDGKTLFAGVCNTSTGPEVWSLYKSTDDGYSWKPVSGYNSLGHSTEPIIAIKASPNWINDGQLYVATTTTISKCKNGTNGKWTTVRTTTGITSIDVALDEYDDVTVVYGTTSDVFLDAGDGFQAQNAGASVLAVAFSPNYAEDGTIIALMIKGGQTVLRAETDVDANNWGSYIADAYFSYTDPTDGVRKAIPALTACIAFPGDYTATQSVFVGINTGNSATDFGVFGSGPTTQKGDAFKVSLSSGLMSTSTATDLNIRGTNTGTDVWSIAVSGEANTANIICGLRYASQTSGMEGWQAQVHLSQDGGSSWAISLKPPSGMVASGTNPGLCAPVVVMAPDFTTSSKVYCGNGYYSNTVLLSGFYVSTNMGAAWNGRGLLDRTAGAITDITPLAQYDTSNTMYMVMGDREIIMGGLVTANIGLLWKTTDGGSHWEIVCDMIPLASLGSAPSTAALRAVKIDKVAVTGDNVFIAGAQSALTIGAVILPVPYTIYRSSDGGNSFPTSIAARGPVEYLLAIDQDTLITANGSNIWKTVNGGGKWKGPEAGSDAITGNVTSLAINGNTILFGTDKGEVYICDDYATDFSFYKMGNTVGNTVTNNDSVLVTFDAAYNTNHIIYAGVYNVNIDSAKTGIWRKDVISSSDTWDRLAFSVTVSPTATVNYTAANSDVFSLACDSNGILWAICVAWNNSGTADATTLAIRAVNPTESTLSKVKFEKVNDGLENTDILIGDLRIADSSIFAVGLTNKLWIYTDTLIKPTLNSPTTTGTTTAGTLLSGTSYAHVTLQWAPMAEADKYQYQVALDSAFNNIATDYNGVMVNRTVEGNSVEVDLYAGTKYYWRVRVALTEPLYSQWSETGSFTTPLGPAAVAPILKSPAAGDSGVRALPLLEWSSIANANKYELVVAKNCDWANPIVNLIGSSAVGDTAYQVTTSLEKDTNYCWKVRALSDISDSSWSATGTFTTAPAPAPAAEEESTPVWVWVVIALSAVLLVSVVMLIVRTRRA